MVIQNDLRIKNVEQPGTSCTVPNCSERAFFHEDYCKKHELEKEEYDIKNSVIKSYVELEKLIGEEKTAAFFKSLPF